MLRTPEIFPNSFIKFLNEDNLDPLVLKKEQAACLLAHMFLCSNIRHSFKKPIPIPRDMNFLHWYSTAKADPVSESKIKCILNYFTRLATEGIPDQDIVFQRLRINTKIHGKCSYKDWLNLEQDFKDVEVVYEGKIEDAENAIEIDFANKFLGGGVLRHGMVQEEIMFTVAPECLIGLLFNYVMEEPEAILIQGTQTYCAYKGYAKSFAYTGNFVDTKPLSEVNPRIFNREIVAIDAIPFKEDPARQYDSKFIIREINKAYVGFSAGIDLSKTRKCISTGRWGCGVFKGDPQLKFLLQWIAASRANREMKFYSFGATDLNDIEKVVEKVGKWTLGKAVKAAIEFGGGRGKKRFFEYLMNL